MAATVTIATATSLEGQAAELLRELKQAEDAWVAAGQALTPTENRTRRLSITPNLTTGAIAYTLSLPAVVTDSPDGFSVEVTEYIV